MGTRCWRAESVCVRRVRPGRPRVARLDRTDAPTNPDWYWNLVADPKVTVEVGSETFPARAEPIEGPERDRLYAEQARRFPGFAEYEKQTDRVIPVVALTRHA